MIGLKHKLVKSVVFCLLVLLAGVSSSCVAFADSSSSQQNTQTGLCYDRSAGLVLNCNNVNSHGQNLSGGKCYISSADNSWQSLDCSNSVFDSGVTASGSEVASQQDPALQEAQKCQSQQGISSSCGLIDKYVNPIIKALSLIVGVVAAIGIISGGIMYSSSSGDPQKAAKAKDRITKAVVALVAYGFLWAFLEWLVPGGFLNG